MATLRTGAAALACAAVLLSLAPAAGAAPGDVSITVDPRPAVVGKPVLFRAAVELPAGAQVAPNGYEWLVRLGDAKLQPLPGQTDSSAEHVFSAAGTAHVRVRVTLTTGAATQVVTQAARFQVVAPAPPPPPSEPPPTQPPPAAQPPSAQPHPSEGNAPPIAGIRFWPISPRVGDQVEFVSLARDPDGAIKREQWDFDNDGRYDAEGSVVSHSFNSAGARTVTLRVTDSGGAVAVGFVTVDVRALQPPVGSQLLSPFPVVRIRGLLLRDGVRVTMLQVRAGQGVKVTVRCSGVGCPFRGPRAWATRGRELRIRRLERHFRAGVRIELLVTKPGRIGKYTAFTVRRGRSPSRSDRCIRPGAERPSVCPND